MPRTSTLAELRTAVLRRGGVERSYDLTEVVLNDFINSSVAELWDILRSKGDDALVVSTSLTSTPGSDTIPLPVNFYKLRVLHIADASTPSGWRRVRSFRLDDAHLFERAATGKRYRYRLQGSSLILSHETPTAETFRLYYVPYAAMLTADADVLDGFNGYEELVVSMAWRKCLERQRLDTSGMDREIARLQARVSSDADGRDVEPMALGPGRSWIDLDEWEVL